MTTLRGLTNIQVEVTGARGAQGASAYQAWLNAGNSGTEADFVQYLAAQANAYDDGLWNAIDPIIDDGVWG